MSRNQAHCGPESSTLDPRCLPTQCARAEVPAKRLPLHRPRPSPGTRTFDVGQNRRVQFAQLGHFLFQSLLNAGQLVHGTGAHPAPEEAHVNEKFLRNWVPRAESPERRGGASRQAPPSRWRSDSSPSEFRLLAGAWFPTVFCGCPGTGPQLLLHQAKGPNGSHSSGPSPLLDLRARDGGGQREGGNREPKTS